MAGKATRTSSCGLCATQAFIAKAHTGYRNRKRLVVVPVVVPDIFLGESPSSAIDHCHSLPFLFPPPAAVGSLPP